MRKIIFQNTSTEEKQEYENTWGGENKRPFTKKAH